MILRIGHHRGVSRPGSCGKTPGIQWFPRLPRAVRQNFDKHARAFNIDRIKISDFKKLNKEETTKFLFDFLNEKDWGDDKNEFATLLNKYFEIHEQFDNNDFYVISKDWFDRDDEKVIEPESWCYIYYFLIISVDRNSNLLTSTEWQYD